MGWRKEDKIQMVRTISQNTAGYCYRGFSHNLEICKEVLGVLGVSSCMSRHQEPQGLTCDVHFRLCYIVQDVGGQLLDHMRYLLKLVGKLFWDSNLVHVGATKYSGFPKLTSMT